MRTSASRSSAARRSALTKILVVLLVLAAVVVAFLIFRNAAPEVTVELRGPGIGQGATPVAVSAVEGSSRGLGDLRLELIQERDGEEVVTVLEERQHTPRSPWVLWGPRDAEDRFEVGVGKETVPELRSGEATLRVVAERPGGLLGMGEPAVAETTVPVRFTPPTLALLSGQHNVAQGGSGAVVYRVGEAALEEGGQDGVRAGDWFFPGYPLPGGEEGERFALFGIPWDLSDPTRIRVEAADGMGNRATTGFIDRFEARPPSQDTINLSDDFLQRVVPAILSQTPEVEDTGDLLQDYLTINGDLRAANAETLRELAAESAAERLWQQAFLPMPGGQVMSSFADQRTYVYDGRDVDQQTHLGFDLASVRHAEVPASARGRVALARYFGIYGNTVVLDHGYGLMTLYSHLSSIEVEEGQEVDRGQTLGRTGATGLAGGDHLHFTVLLGGLPVNPVEWWDSRFIDLRLLPKLEAGRPAPADGDAQEGTAGAAG